MSARGEEGTRREGDIRTLVRIARTAVRPHPAVATELVPPAGFHASGALAPAVARLPRPLCSAKRSGFRGGLEISAGHGRNQVSQAGPPKFRRGHPLDAARARVRWLTPRPVPGHGRWVLVAA